MHHISIDAHPTETAIIVRIEQANGMLFIWKKEKVEEKIVEFQKYNSFSVIFVSGIEVKPEKYEKVIFCDFS